MQRPGAEASIAADVHLLRRAVGAAQRAAGVRRDLRPLVDEVGRSLYQELDFRWVCGGWAGAGFWGAAAQGPWLY